MGVEALDLAIFLPAFDGDRAGIEWLETAMRESPGAAVWAVSVDGQQAGYVAGRLVGSEFEVLAAVGTGGVSVEVMEAVREMAKKLGAVAVYFDTWRPGLMELAKRAGWRAATVRMWKAV